MANSTYSPIPALEQGGTILALAGDDDGLAEMRQIAESIPDLKPWADEVARHASVARQSSCRLIVATLKHSFVVKPPYNHSEPKKSEHAGIEAHYKVPFVGSCSIRNEAASD